MRLGLFGGTFDPPHVGHLLAASDAFEALRLDTLIWIPAGQPPFKANEVHASAIQRAEMLEQMVAGDARFTVDRLEIDRDGLSFTVETLAEYARQHPGARRFLLIGADLVSQLPQWREAERIPALAEIVVLERGAGEESAPHVFPAVLLPSRRVDLSSTEVRMRIQQKLPIHGFVTDAVARYITAAGLYR
ncbi:MAG TPA: nicotinate-nucleotide adenylyltransferase [Gemmatimonadaceae bacterium]|nr:nicotinate-nucleotide adenylyltransferase [Gemmatimonadaceae bacterium]